MHLIRIYRGSGAEKKKKKEFIVTVLRSHRILPRNIKGLEKVERDIVFLDGNSIL